jgi:folylpolyglutamate synthase/dihydropteroate synthase
MPSVSLDTDEKYTNLVEIYQNLTKNSQSDNTKCQIFDNVYDALNWLTEFNEPELAGSVNSQSGTGLNTTNQVLNADKKINILVTGSLYLVGLSLKVLNFKIN